MRRTVFYRVGILCALLASVSLAGCDLLGLSPKKTHQAAQKTETMPASSESNSQSSNQGQSDNGPLPANVLARVGTWTLTADEFNARLKLLKQSLPDFDDKDPKAKKMVLDELVRQQLLAADAEAAGVGNQKDIKDAVADFRKTLLVQEEATRLTKGVEATETDAHDYYEKNKDSFIEPVKWDVREIVVPDQATAKNLLVQILQGGDFAQLAKAQSKGKTAAEGGALNTFTKAPFPEMQKALAGLDAGGVSAVFKGPEGYYILKVDSKTGGELKPFSDVKKDLVDGLTMQKQQQVLLDYLNKLAQKYKVQINQNMLGSSDSGNK